MNFPFATPKALVFAGLTAVFCLLTMMAKAQTGSEQSILYSAPDGQSVSNALLPSAQAPGTSGEIPNLPEAQPGFEFSSTPGQPMLIPRPILPPRHKQQDDSDIRKSMGLETPAEAMGVPTARELFGLPNAKVTNSMSQYDEDAAASNYLSSGAANSDSSWAKILSADSDAFQSAKTADSNSLRGAFFDSDTSDSMFREKKADDEKADDDFNTSSFSQINDGQPAQSALAATDPFGAQANTAGLAQNPAPAASAFSEPSASSQSPFALPKVSAPESTMPQLPTLPGVAGQNAGSPSQPARPSWAPKPPPWLDPTPQPGTMPQRKF